MRRLKKETFSFSNFNKTTRTHVADGILVTNKTLMDQAPLYFDMRRTERIRLLDEYRHCFKKVGEDELVPVYDQSGIGTSPIAYVDEENNMYDTFYDEETMQLVTIESFSYKQIQLYYIGPPGASKTMKILATPGYLALIGKYVKGLHSEYAVPIDSQERVRMKEMVRNYQRGNLPERNLFGEELEPLPIRINSFGKSLIVENIAQPGEELEQMGWENGIFENPNGVTVFIFSPEDHLRMADGETEVDSMDILERYIYYGIRRGGIKAGHKFMLVIPKADLLKNDSNIHIQKILKDNTIVRDKNGYLALKDEGILDLDKLEEMQKEAFLYIRDTNPILFNKLEEISRYCQVEIFVNADLNQEVEGLSYNPKEITPFRTDEFWLYILYLNGMVKAKTKDEAKRGERDLKRGVIHELLRDWNQKAAWGKGTEMLSELFKDKRVRCDKKNDF